MEDREKVTSRCKSRSDSLHILYSLQPKSLQALQNQRRTRRKGHEGTRTHMAELRNAYKFIAGNKKKLDLGVDGKLM
jgi:hypothetical protein